ncbi:MAG: hypothetical protein Q9M36_05625 [Sulfurovum sp.]|nr:hypothetical protein [Sulfurovum sp.]
MDNKTTKKTLATHNQVGIQLSLVASRAIDDNNKRRKHAKNMDK